MTWLTALWGKPDNKPEPIVPVNPSWSAATPVYNIKQADPLPGVIRKSHTNGEITRNVPTQYRKGMHVLEIEPDANGEAIIHFRSGWLQIKVKGWEP